MVVLSAVVYYLDYYLSVLGESLLRKGADKFVKLEDGYELTRIFVSDVRKKRAISPRFILLLVLTAGSIFFVRLVVPESKEVFDFVAGIFLLMEAPLIIRHIEQIYTFRYGVRRQGMVGSIEYARWLNHGIVSVYSLCFVGLFILCSVITGSFFLAGGAYACLVNAVAHYRLMRKHLKDKPATTRIEDPFSGS